MHSGRWLGHQGFHCSRWTVRSEANAKKLGLSMVELDKVIHVLNDRREEGLARGARTVPSARRGSVRTRQEALEMNNAWLTLRLQRWLPTSESPPICLVQDSRTSLAR